MPTSNTTIHVNNPVGAAVPGVYETYTWGLSGTRVSNSSANVRAVGAQSFVFSAVGLSPQTTLTFSFRDDPGFIILDAVSVVQGTIPEPATFVLIAIGMLAAATARLRKAI